VALQELYALEQRKQVVLPGPGAYEASFKHLMLAMQCNQEAQHLHMHVH
jgi:hypothetical protein